MRGCGDINCKHCGMPPNKTEKKHWIFHKYKWTTYDTKPIFVTGFFQDYTLERRFQEGQCECGAYRFREIDTDPLLEMEIEFTAWRIAQAKKAEQEGNIDLAIEILKS